MFLDKYSFSICDTSNFSEYVKGGVATEVKQTEKLSFVSIAHDWFIPYWGYLTGIINYFKMLLM